jgi:(2Fe-2S) ferredoxin
MICVRGECAPREKGFNLEKRLLELIEAHGLDDPEHPQHLRCTVTNCLAVCHSGPVMMVHPEGIRYINLTEETLELIFQHHFLADQPVKPLIYDERSSRSITSSRRRRQR